MAFCSNSAILSQYEPGIKVNCLKCKRWSCSECIHIRTSRLRNEAYRGRPNTFLTLTANPKWGVSPEHRARSLKEAWTRIHRKAKAFQKGKKLEYICIFETTKQGEPHLHILARSSWISQKWLSEQMETEMNAPIVDIRRLNNAKAASNYVSKYVSKAPEKFPGTKRYWRSLGYLIIPEKPWKNPDGEPRSKWWTPGTLAEIEKQYKKWSYELQTFEVGNKIEYWLWWDRPELIKSAEEPSFSQVELW